MGIERHDSRLALQMRKRRGQIVRRRGTHVAEILRDDQVGLDRAQNFKIDAVEALAAFEKFAHLPVNRRGALRVRNARLDQDRLGFAPPAGNRIRG